jgi:NhaP-type Na+/H+ or K+/H+ antiporter
VTGPTVVGPLLLHIRPRGSVGSILKWEGILIDPIGAVFAVLVLEAVVAGQLEHAPAIMLLGVIKTLVVGVAIGGAAAVMLVLFLRRYWIPEHLQPPATVGVVVLSFVISNALVHESGLLTVTLMGVIMANQRYVQVRHVIEFKENLRILLISSLFILLAARLQWEHLQMFDLWVVAFMVALIVFVRPLAVLVCTARSRLSWSERGFIAWMAPRGIVAAAISSVFAERLELAGYEEAQALVALTFLVVATTVLVYGLTSPALARLLKVSQPDAQGAVIIGAHGLARAIASALKQVDIPTLLIDRNWSNISVARIEGLRAHYGDAISEHLLEEIDFDDMGRVFAITANNQVNSLAILHFADVFGRTGTYQLPQSKGSGRNLDRATPPAHLRGRTLFGKDQTFFRLNGLLEAGGEVRVTKLTREFTFDEFTKQHADNAVPLFSLTEQGNLRIFTAEDAFVPAAGSRLISLIGPNGDHDHSKNRERAEDASNS